MNEEIQKKITEYLDFSTAFAKEVVEKYGPEAWNIMLQVKRIDSIRDIVQTIVMGVAAYCIYRFSKVMFARYAKDVDNGQRYSDETAFYSIAGTISFAIFCILGFAFVMEVCAVWDWIGVVYPDIAIAHDVMAKVMKK